MADLDCEELSAIFRTLEVPCAVRNVPGKGKCVIATHDIPEGTVLVEEIPLVSWAFPRRYQRSEPYCFFCLRDLSSGCDYVTPCSTCTAVFCNDTCQSQGDFAHSILCGLSDHLRSSRSLCVGDTQDDLHPPINLDALARCACAIVQRYIRVRRSNPDVDITSLFNAAARPFNRLVEPLDTATKPFANVDLHAAAPELRSVLSSRLAAAIEAAVGPTRSSEDACASSLASAEAAHVVDAVLSDAAVRTLLGQLILNSTAINADRIDAPSCPVRSGAEGVDSVSLAADGTSLVDDSDKIGQAEDVASLTSHVRDEGTAHAMDDGEEARAVFAPVGAGVYILQACLNHSCTPNVSMSFGAGTHELSLVAAEPMRAGDELCISYLNDLQLLLMPVAARRAALQNYLFTCECKRCVTEERAGSVSSTVVAA